MSVCVVVVREAVEVMVCVCVCVVVVREAVEVMVCICLCVCTLRQSSLCGIPSIIT